MNRRKSVLASIALLGAALLLIPSASSSPNPASVTIAGSLQSELGCPGDWDPACATTHLSFDAYDDVWQGSWSVPAGDYEYKAALNDGWDENYGLHAAPGGANIPLAGGSTVKFYYDHKSHWITDSRNSVIAVAPGSFQSELGCPGDWEPDCLRSWLQDPDGDGIYTFTTTDLPAGAYEAQGGASNESWDVNYGAGRRPERREHRLRRPGRPRKGHFTYDAATHVLTISAGHGAGQQRRVGRPPSRLAQHALPDARRRGARRHAGDPPLPHVPRRRHRREAASLRRQRERPALCR